MPQITPSFLFAAEEVGGRRISTFRSSRIQRSTTSATTTTPGPCPLARCLPLTFNSTVRASPPSTPVSHLSSTNPSRFRSTARAKTTSTTTGSGLARAGKKASAGGSAIASVSVGRSCPIEMIRFLSDPDPDRAQRAMAAMLQMRKLDLRGLPSSGRPVDLDERRGGCSPAKSCSYMSDRVRELVVSTISTSRSTSSRVASGFMKVNFRAALSLDVGATEHHLTAGEESLLNRAERRRRLRPSPERHT